MNKKVVWVIIGILAVLLYFNLDKFTLVTVPLKSGTSASPYICPADVSFCEVNGVIQCDTVSGSQEIVIARTDDFDFSSGWIAYDNGFGGLDSYVFESVFETFTPTTLGTLNSILSTKYFRDIYINEVDKLLYVEGGMNLHDLCDEYCASRVRSIELRLDRGDSSYPSCPELPIVSKSIKHTMCRYKSSTVGWVNDGYQACTTCSYPAYYKYKFGSGADIDPTSKNDCSGVEVCSGESNLYSCSGTVKKQVDGAVVDSDTITYSSGIAGETRSKSFILLPSESLTIDGGDSNYIEWSTKQIIEECNLDRCVSDIAYKMCVNDRLSDELILCDAERGENCIQSVTGVSCGVPFDISVSFEDVDGRSRTGFTQDEDIIVKVKVFSKTLENGDVTVILMKDETTVDEKIKSGFNFQSALPVNLLFSNPQEIGTYKVIIKISSGDISFTSETVYNFRISTPIESNFITPYIEIDGVRSSKLFTNTPIFVEFRVSSSGEPTEAIPDVKAFLDNREIMLPPYIIPKVGTYLYKFNVDRAGLLRVEGTAARGGFVTTLTSIESNVESARLKIEFVDIELLKNVELGSTHTVKFLVKNQADELVSSVNAVSVRLPSGLKIDISDTVRYVEGIYMLDYTFSSRGGYIFSITSSKAGFIGDKKSSLIINSARDIIELECTKDTDCKADEICKANKCILDVGCRLDRDCDSGEKCVDNECRAGNNLLLIVSIILGSLVIVGLIIYFIIRRRI